MSALPVVLWTLSLSVSDLTAHCPRCGRSRRFTFADAARLNAHRKRLDAWLLYDCEVCGGTHKVELFARTPVRSVDPALLAILHGSDGTLLRPLAAATVGGQGWAVTGDVPDREAEVRFAVAQGVRARLDAVLARGLGCARSQVVAWSPDVAGCTKVRDGLRVRLQPPEVSTRI